MYHKFFDTTLGKTLKVALWTGLSYAVASLITAVTLHPSLFVFGGIAIGPLLNVVLYMIKNLADENVPNLPSSSLPSPF